MYIKPNLWTTIYVYMKVDNIWRKEKAWRTHLYFSLIKGFHLKENFLHGEKRESRLLEIILIMLCFSKYICNSFHVFFSAKTWRIIKVTSVISPLLFLTYSLSGIYRVLARVDSDMQLLFLYKNCSNAFIKISRIRRNM